MDQMMQAIVQAHSDSVAVPNLTKEILGIQGVMDLDHDESNGLNKEVGATQDNCCDFYLEEQYTGWKMTICAPEDGSLKK